MGAMVGCFFARVFFSTVVDVVDESAACGVALEAMDCSKLEARSMKSEVLTTPS
jgi:hypothetical protein